MESIFTKKENLIDYKKIVDDFEGRKLLIIRKIEITQDKNQIADYLLLLSLAMESQNKWYLLGIDVTNLYFDYVESHEILNAEKELINILFRACVESKRHKVARRLLAKAEKHNLEIAYANQYRNQIREYKLQLDKKTTIQLILTTLFFGGIYMNYAFFKFEKNVFNVTLFAGALFLMTVGVELYFFFNHSNR